MGEDALPVSLGDCTIENSPSSKEKDRKFKYDLRETLRDARV